MKHVVHKEVSICEAPFFVASVDETTRQAYRDIDCPACLRQALAASEARTRAIRDLLSKAADRPQALCHECSEIVDVVDGKLDPHHGETGDGCPQNGAAAQIYLHPKVVALIHELTPLPFGGDR